MAMWLSIFVPGFDLAITLRGDHDLDDYWPATHLAILDILLFFYRPVNENRDDFTAVWTANIFFLKKVH
jgi:hypothetical protein